jgi:hypothetical protein
MRDSGSHSEAGSGFTLGRWLSMARRSRMVVVGAVTTALMLGTAPSVLASSTPSSAPHLYFYNYLNAPPPPPPPGVGTAGAPPVMLSTSCNFHEVSVGTDNHYNGSFIGVSDVHTDLSVAVANPGCTAFDSMTVGLTQCACWLEFGTMYENNGGSQEDYWYGYYCGSYFGYGCSYIMEDGPVSKGQSHTFYLFKVPGTSQYDWALDCTCNVFTSAQAPWIDQANLDQIYLESYDAFSSIPYATFTSMKTDLSGGDWVNWIPSGPSSWQASAPMYGNYLSNTSAWTQEK